MFAEVIINNNAKALNRVFDYEVPEELENEIFIGARILVPFGKSSKLDDGFVINLKEKSEFANKFIAKIVIEHSLDENRINLAKLMSYKYFCNISDCIKLMLPPGTSSKEIKAWEKEKTGNFVYLKISPKEIDDLINNKKLKSDKHIRVLNFLAQNDGMYISDLETITNVSRAILKTLEKKEYIEFVEKQIKRNPFLNKDIKKDKPKKLTEEQERAYNCIGACIENNEYTSSLIYGITGSGKTEIYLQLIAKALKQNKTAIMLVPEISLTPQIVDRFLARFGNNIAILHSKLSSGERYDEWQKIKNGEAKIVIGARSAIFAPVKNLGIIIIDEEHDVSYKSDMTPRYNSKDLAKYIAEKANCPLVLGSATPDLSTYQKALKNEIALFKLTKRANSSCLPEVKIVDLRKELAAGNKSMLSLDLQEEIKKNIDDKKQTMLFLNRRGYSTFVMCRDCGEPIKCPNCSISLTYHKFENKLKCHYCGFESRVLKTCPSCGSDKVKYFGTGTQKLEEEIHSVFPEATTIRMDIDTVTKKNSHEQILNKFRNEKIDILIGTQMIVKGHHFPNVTLVGAVSADSLLNIEDYKAVERTFQTLVQVAGRAGREEDKGRVIIQTYNPDHYAIEYSAKQDYDLFFKTEIDFRKKLKYPPFCDIIIMRFVGKNIDEIQRISKEIFTKLSGLVNPNTTYVYKPCPSPIDKLQGKYRYRIIIKGKVNSRLLNSIYKAMDVEVKEKTSITVDINPNSMI